MKNKKYIVTLLAKILEEEDAVLSELAEKSFDDSMLLIDDIDVLLTDPEFHNVKGCLLFLKDHLEESITSRSLEGFFNHNNADDPLTDLDFRCMDGGLVERNKSFKKPSSFELLDSKIDYDSFGNQKNKRFKSIINENAGSDFDDVLGVDNNGNLLGTSFPSFTKINEISVKLPFFKKSFDVFLFKENACVFYQEIVSKILISSRFFLRDIINGFSFSDSSISPEYIKLRKYILPFKEIILKAKKCMDMEILSPYEKEEFRKCLRDINGIYFECKLVNEKSVNLYGCKDEYELLEKGSDCIIDNHDILSEVVEMIKGSLHLSLKNYVRDLASFGLIKKLEVLNIKCEKPTCDDIKYVDNILLSSFFDPYECLIYWLRDDFLFLFDSFDGSFSTSYTNLDTSFSSLFELFYTADREISLSSEMKIPVTKEYILDELNKEKNINLKFEDGLLFDLSSASVAKLADFAFTWLANKMHNLESYWSSLIQSEELRLKYLMLKEPMYFKYNVSPSMINAIVLYSFAEGNGNFTYKQWEVFADMILAKVFACIAVCDFNISSIEDDSMVVTSNSETSKPDFQEFDTYYLLNIDKKLHGYENSKYVFLSSSNDNGKNISFLFEKKLLSRKNITKLSCRMHRLCLKDFRLSKEYSLDYGQGNNHFYGVHFYLQYTLLDSDINSDLDFLICLQKEGFDISKFENKLIPSFVKKFIEEGFFSKCSFYSESFDTSYLKEARETFLSQRYDGLLCNDFDEKTIKIVIDESYEKVLQENTSKGFITSLSLHVEVPQDILLGLAVKCLDNGKKVSDLESDGFDDIIINKLVVIYYSNLTEANDGDYSNVLFLLSAYGFLDCHLSCLAMCLSINTSFFKKLLFINCYDSNFKEIFNDNFEKCIKFLRDRKFKSDLIHEIALKLRFRLFDKYLEKIANIDHLSVLKISEEEKNELALQRYSNSYNFKKLYDKGFTDSILAPIAICELNHGKSIGVLLSEGICEKNLIKEAFKLEIYILPEEISYFSKKGIDYLLATYYFEGGLALIRDKGFSRLYQVSLAKVIYLGLRNGKSKFISKFHNKEKYFNKKLTFYSFLLKEGFTEKDLYYLVLSCYEDNINFSEFERDGFIGKVLLSAVNEVLKESFENKEHKEKLSLLFYDSCSLRLVLVLWQSGKLKESGVDFLLKKGFPYEKISYLVEFLVEHLDVSISKLRERGVPGNFLALYAIKLYKDDTISGTDLGNKGFLDSELQPLCENEILKGKNKNDLLREGFGIDLVEVCYALLSHLSDDENMEVEAEERALNMFN